MNNSNDQPDGVDPAKDAILESQGLEEVRLLLLRTAPEEYAQVAGLIGPDRHFMKRGYVRGWVRRKEAERLQQEQNDRRWTRTAGRAAIVAAVAAVLALIVSVCAWLLPVQGSVQPRISPSAAPSVVRPAPR